MKDLTPKHLKCSATMSCPSIHRLEDGRIMIVGDDGVPEAFARDIQVGAAESAVTITADLLSLYVSEKTDKLQAQVDACYNAMAGALVECECIVGRSGQSIERARSAAYLLREAIAGLFGEDLIQATAETDLPKCDHPVSEMDGIEIDLLGGNCPLQAEGRIDGKPFYFRARGESWSLGIGGEPVLDPEWGHLEDWGDGPYSAGWMEEAEALRMIAKGAAMYREAHPQASGDRTENAPIKTSVEP
jgi:hypothetical protein